MQERGAAMSGVDKRELVRLLRFELAAEIENLTRIALIAREAATHEEARPENDKDTRSVEAAYLAGAQAERVRELERASVALDRMQLRAFAEGESIALSALVTVAGSKHRYFLASQGGGRRAQVSGVEVQVVTSASPLGEALVGCAAGDVAEVQAASGMRRYEILAVE